MGHVVLILWLLLACSEAGITSRYTRRLEGEEDLPESSERFVTFEASLNLPEQVHLTQGDYNGHSVIVSWITPTNSAANIIQYGKTNGSYTNQVFANVSIYLYGDYTSGFIHHAKLENLEYNTKYFYKLGIDNAFREFSFNTPAEVGQSSSHVFGLTADLGQTSNSAATLDHYIAGSGQTMLYVGDMSYADKYRNNSQVRWDTWSRLIEKSTAFQSWIWAVGDHEIDTNNDIGETERFKPFNNRFPVPFKESGSSSSLYYSFKRASAHLIVLSFYTDYAKGSTQYQWLTAELSKVNRSETPWLIILEHVPWYNSNSHHYQQGDAMRAELEHVIVSAKADLFIAGHVHAYERTFRVSTNCSNGTCISSLDENAPIYINIGDGGNSAGLVGKFVSPQPSYSAFREASYGHALLSIHNRTHAFYSWHRNQDGASVMADSIWILNRVWSS